MVEKNYHVEKNKHLFFAHYLICLIMFFDVFNDYFLGRISIFLGRISKWGRGGGEIFSKIYTPDFFYLCFIHNIISQIIDNIKRYLLTFSLFLFCLH